MWVAVSNRLQNNRSIYKIILVYYLAYTYQLHGLQNSIPNIIINCIQGYLTYLETTQKGQKGKGKMLNSQIPRIYYI